MKKLFAISLAVILMVVSVIPAYAAETARTTYNFNVRGTIAAIDRSTGEITVHVLFASVRVKQYVGQNLVVDTTRRTVYMLRNDNGSKRFITFTDLKVGETVRVVGTFSTISGIYTANIVRQAIVLPEPG